MSISEQKWSKAPWQSFPASRACQWAQLCSLALKHHLKVQADNHLNDLFFLYTQHLVRGWLSQESSTLNLRMLQQNCFTSSQPDFQGRFHLQIITSCKPFTLSMSCCEECAVLLKLSSPAPTANLSTPQIGLGSELQSVSSLFQEAIQAQVLNHPVCYWCYSWRNWFPASVRSSHTSCTLYAKNLTLNGICEFFFFFQEPLQSWEKQQVFYYFICSGWNMFFDSNSD